MPNTPRITTALSRSAISIRATNERKNATFPNPGPLHPTAAVDTCQDDFSWNGNGRNRVPQLTSPFQNRYGHGSRLRILVLNDKSLPLPEKLLELVQREDSNAIIRNNWNAVCDMLADDRDSV